MTAILEMRGVSKSFSGVQALRDVNFTVEAGQIHALVGENGAGKSTLMKVLSGVYPYGDYEGSIIFDGEERRFRDVNDSEALGIIIIHQELALIPLMSIAENIFLSHPPQRLGVIDRDTVYRRTRELLAQVGLTEMPDTLVTDLGVGKQQLVEIAKALSKRVRLLILDEPTASLNENDSAALLDRLLAFRAQGIASILISHKLSEVARVADRITVLRDGRTVDSIDCRAEPVEEDRIIRSMVDRDLAHRFPQRTATIGEPVFAVQDWTVHHPLHRERRVIKGVDFEVRRGEVVGIAGLMGAGRTEFAMSLFGRAWGERISGRVWLDGQGSQPVERGGGNRCRARLRHRGSQAARPDPGQRRPQEHHARQASAAWRGRASSTTCPNCASRATTATGCGSAVPTSIRRPASSPAATSRRWCCRNG